MFSGYSTDTSRQGLIYIGTDESQTNRAVAVVIGGSGSSTIVSLGGLAYSSTPVTSSSDTRIATTAFVKAQGYASLASPTFSGTVSIPTLTLGTALGPTYGGTGIGSYTTGDLLYASATNTLAKRAAGTDGYVLTMSGGVPTWAPGGGGGGGVTSLQGTADQVLVGGTSGTPQTGALTLTLPQNIGTSSAPTFDQVTATTRLNTAKLYASTASKIELDSVFGGEFTFKGAGMTGRSVTLSAGDRDTSGDSAGSLYLTAGNHSVSGQQSGNLWLSAGKNTASGRKENIFIGTGIGNLADWTNQAREITIGGDITNSNLDTVITLYGPTIIYGGLSLSGTKLDVSNIAPSTTNGYVLTTISGSTQWRPVSSTAGGTVTRVTLNAGSTGLTVNAATSAEITTFGTFTLGGTLALANGGTGASLTAANGQVAYSTTTALALTSGGSTGQVLKFSSGSAPTWGDVTVPAQPYDLRGKFVGTPASSVVLDTFIADRVATISSTSTHHKFSAKILPLAGSVILTVQRTRTTLGVPATVTVFTATSSSTDTILNGYYPMTISPVTNGDLLENDVLEVVVQAAAFDAAFATPVFTISAVA